MWMLGVIQACHTYVWILQLWIAPQPATLRHLPSLLGLLHMRRRGKQSSTVFRLVAWASPALPSSSLAAMVLTSMPCFAGWLVTNVRSLVPQAGTVAAPSTTGALPSVSRWRGSQPLPSPPPQRLLRWGLQRFAGRSTQARSLPHGRTAPQVCLYR